MLKSFTSLSNLRKTFALLNNYYKLTNAYYFSNNNGSDRNRNQKISKGQDSQSQINTKSNLVNKHGVFIDEEKIKAKMKQLKQRASKSGEESKKPKSEFMKNYQINKEPTKVKKFRKDTESENLMQIEDVSLDEKPTVLQISSFSNSQIEIDGFPYPPSIIITPNQALLWEIKTIKQVRPQHLKLIQLVNPPPQYVIIGCSNVSQVSNQVRNYLQSLGINYDIVEMFEAVSNYNTFSGDDIRVMAFLVTNQEPTA